MRGFLRRHRASLASGTALAVAAGAVAVYAVTAEGYREHRTELNDGGIWVTTSDRGYFGRMNKPIGRLDGAFYYEPDTVLDVVQDGAAIVGLNRRSGRALGLDAASVGPSDGAVAAVAGATAVEMRGGTLAALGRDSGKLWASRYDPQAGQPAVGAIDRQSEPFARVGEESSLTVTAAGDVLVASAADATLTTFIADGFELGEGREQPLPEGAGAPSDLTAVGDVAVTLDAGAGRLAVVDGPVAQVPAAGVLQEAGPGASTVLVATDGALDEVDLEDGTVSTLTEDVSGRPTAPVRLGACVYAAWSGGTGYVLVRCGSDAPTVTRLRGNATDLAFRVNRGQILLNDQRSGAVWDLDSESPEKIDNWEVFTDSKRVDKKERDDEQQRQGDRRRPEAKPDRFGARPGRTSVLFPLDNDTAAEGRLLAITDVGSPGLPGARVSVSPDRQTVQLSLPGSARGTLRFDYQIDDGRTMSARSTVTVDVRDGGANVAPRQRDGFEPALWRVPARGSVEIPVLPDWRDYEDSDPLLLDSVQLAGDGGARGAMAQATGHGRVRFTAPDAGGDFVVRYAVTDGLAPPVSRELRVQVQDKFDQEAHPASAEPDVVSGEVGRPILVRPLANDLPGSDPATPHAEIRLAGRLAHQSGLRLRTDTERGVVRVEAQRPGTYLLDYDAAYGNAPLARGRIRVDVQPRPARAQDPVAMPDTLTLHGQSAAPVDVLANDVDPAGGILVVQGARAVNPEQLDVSVIEGRWLRISPRQGELTPRTQVVRYTVSNGAMSGVTGEVVVSQRPAPADDTPVPTPDRAVVRAGEVVAHPVLDNDHSPSGARLELVPDHLGGAPGELSVLPPQDFGGDPGTAYAAGRTVRYVAPAEVAERETFTIPYLVATPGGETAEGRLSVVVVPADAENAAPDPPTLEGRMVAGDTLSLELPGAGVDPDGDPVTITGIGSPPRLGRVMDFGAGSLSYQAFLGTVGTEEFSYTVTDTRGAEATGTIRVAVVPPTPPQPPVAVPDTLTVAPGATGRIDVLANDQVASGDSVRVTLVDPGPGVSLESEQGPLLVQAPRGGDAARIDVVYSITNGLATSTAVASLVVVEGVNNPPVVQDAFGRADDSDSVTVDLLGGDGERQPAFDPDGPPGDLTVSEVHADPEIYTLDGDRLTVRRAAQPRVVPFRVSDAQGGVTTASLYVPATGHGRPYLRDGSLVELDMGGRARVDLADHVVDPAGRTVTLNGRQRVWASPPGQLDARGTAADRVELSARGGFRGPAALLVEVVAEGPEGDGADGDGAVVDGAEGDGPADAEGDARPPTTPTLVSIPVQVGDDRPELDCPDDPLTVSQSGSIEIDIASVCFVWTLDPEERFTLDYSAGLATDVPGVSVADPSGSRVRVSAAGAARAGSEAAVVVRAGDSEPQTLRVQVTRAPSPSLLPIQVADMRPGSSRQIDLASYLRAGVSDAQPTILDVRRVAGSSVRASASGSVLQLTAPGGAEGRSEFVVEMSDVAGDPGPERRVTGRVSLEVLDVPTVPGAPVDVDHLDRAIRLSWPASRARGAPIDHYEVMELRTGRRQRFRATIGNFRVPDNGRSYSFVVRAHNRVGYSDWSARSRSAVTDTRPSRVPWIRMADRGDGTITLRWGQPRSRTSSIQTYYISYQGGQPLSVRGDQRTAVITGLNNNRTYEFTITSRNQADLSEPRTSGPFQSLGTPSPPGGIGLTDLQSGRDSTTVEVRWNETAPEGPGPTTYTVRARSGNDTVTVPGCVRIPEPTCRHTGVAYDGRSWRYTVTASNQPGNTSAESNPAVFDAVGRPDPWPAWSVRPTGQDRTVTLDFTVPESRGTQSRVTILVDGEARVTRELKKGARSETIQLGTNERPYSVALRLCNELGDPQGCVTSNSQQVQSYGSLNGRLASVTGVAGAPRTIDWTVTGTTNGRPAQLQVSVAGAAPVVYELPGTGAFSRTFSTTTPEYEQAQQIVVRLVDPQVPRGSAEAVAEAVSGVGPPPDVTLSRVPCSDTPGSERPECGRPVVPCTASSCGFLAITTTDMTRPFVCTVRHPSHPAVPFTLEYEDNGTKVTNLLYEWGTVTVTCEERGGNRPSTTVSIDWPS